MFTLLTRFPALSAIVLAFTGLAQDGVVGANEEPVPGANEKEDANSIVQAALQAEVDGDMPLREALLTRALECNSNHSPARWHSGHVQVSDQWLTVDQAEDNATRKSAVAAYRKLRNLHAGSLTGELALARWCRKHRLPQRERLHWAGALRLDPSNTESRRRLGVREFDGRLLTANQIKDWKENRRAIERASQYWRPRLKRWRREIESSPSPNQSEAWKQFSNVEDHEAVPSLVQMFATSKPEMQRHIVEVLGNIKEQVATDALVRLAVDGPSSEIREAAGAELSDRSWFGFVPSLLNRLGATVECRYYVDTFGDGIFSNISYSQEQPFRVLNVSRSVNARYPIVIQPNATESGISNAVYRQRAAVTNEASNQYRRVFQALQAVQAKNTRTNRFNERIYAALRTSTGQQHGSRPQFWWDWWKDYNEIDAGVVKPEIDYRDTKYCRRIIHSVSCFPAGTLVWTDIGPVAIESMRRGDRVLSQHPNSGELTYQLVLDTTIRPPSETLKILVADERIEATLGHPFWVVGDGWRMAKELKVGDQLHGVQGGVTIDKIEPGETVEAHNLIVADTNTYFVGKHRVLVHDNKPRRAIELPVPGWSAK